MEEVDGCFHAFLRGQENRPTLEIMGTPLDDMRRLRDQLRKELERNELFVSWVSLDRAVATAERALNSASTDSAAPSDFVSASRLVERILESYGRPLRTPEIVAAMQEHGYQFQGANPLGNAASILSKSKKLVSVQVGPNRRFDRAWWFAGREVPAIGSLDAVNGS